MEDNVFQRILKEIFARANDDESLFVKLVLKNGGSEIIDTDEMTYIPNSGFVVIFDDQGCTKFIPVSSIAWSEI